MAGSVDIGLRQNDIDAFMVDNQLVVNIHKGSPSRSTYENKENIDHLKCCEVIKDHL